MWPGGRFQVTGGVLLRGDWGPGSLSLFPSKLPRVD